MSLEVIQDINTAAKKKSVRVNKIVIVGRVPQFQKAFAELGPKPKSHNFFYRQAKEFVDIERWNITGRFWWWASGIYFGSPERGEILIKATEQFFLWLRKHGTASTNGFHVDRAFFEIKHDFDLISVKLTDAFLHSRTLEYQQLLTKQQMLLEELKGIPVGILAAG